jgi:repressor LexA
MMPRISYRTRAVLDYVAEYIAATGYSPTVREIAAGCSLTSTSVASYHLRLLERGGYLTRAPGMPRTIRLVEQRGGEDG